MSSEANFVTSLVLALSNLYKFGGPILIGLGTVSCILSLAVFTKKTLRKNPCSIYFIAYNISDLFFIYTSIILATLSNGYNIDPSSVSLTFCRFRFYVTYLFDVLSPSYLILASVDRLLITSRNALTRQRSTTRLAYISIISMTLFWLLAHSHAFFLTDILQLLPGVNVCYFHPGIYVTILTYYSIIIKGILVPFLMLVLGLGAITNIRGVGLVAPAPVTATAETMGIRDVRVARTKDRQLLRILLIDISIYLVFSIMISVVLLYQQFNPVSSDNIGQVALQNLLFYAGAFSGYIPFCVGCYTNLLVSKTFRTEVKNILICK